MVFKKLTKRLRGGKSSPFKAPEWDLERARQLTHNLQEPRHTDPFHGISWVAMACFIEEVDPQTLSLSRDDFRGALSGLERLRAMKPLEAYAGCLERLSQVTDNTDDHTREEEEDERVAGEE